MVLEPVAGDGSFGKGVGGLGGLQRQVDPLTVLGTRLHGFTGRGGGSRDNYLSWVWELVQELVAVQIGRSWLVSQGG